MMGAHTKGPWVFGHAGDSALWVGPIYDKKPVALVPWDTDDARDNARADAQAISATPDLIEALQMLIADFADYPASDRPCLAFDKARAALAKAQGGAK